VVVGLQAVSAFSIPTLGAALCILIPDGSQITDFGSSSSTTSADYFLQSM
jgi:hypothetical protein